MHASARADLMPRSGGVVGRGRNTGAPPALCNHTFRNGNECGGGPAVSNCLLYGVGDILRAVAFSL